MTSVEEVLAPLREAVKSQGDIVRQLKADNAPEFDVKKAVSVLKAKKKELENKELLLCTDTKFDRLRMDDLIKRRFVYDQSFSIYGGLTGLYDFGPVGCAIKSNVLQYWRSHFILEEQMLEIECSMLTPAPVLKASGHVDRFSDYMVKDLSTGECLRADHLIEGHLEKLSSAKDCNNELREEYDTILRQLDNFGVNELNSTIKKYKVVNPTTGNSVSEAMPFNLMFSTEFGPTSSVPSYLRPETAQGIFVNFKRLLEFNQGDSRLLVYKLVIVLGMKFHRVQDSLECEIEHFLDPADKSHPKFDRVKNIEVLLYDRESQMTGQSPQYLSFEKAIEMKLIANTTLAYFMARIYLFLVKIGCDVKKIRFRQHLENEMSHYACDCWDAEMKTSYGWIECVGCADRSCYDLTQHTKATNTSLVAEKRLDAPVTRNVTEVSNIKSVTGKVFKQDNALLEKQLADLTDCDIKELKEELNSKGSYKLVAPSGKVFELTPEMLKIKEYEKTFHEEFVPSVIEPSFGIGRILYAIFEHSFQIREKDEQRTYFSLSPLIAPYKCCVLPLSNRPEFDPYVSKISSALTEEEVSHKVDQSSVSIGKRYARMDEIGVPFAIAVDFDTTSQNSVSIRDRDSMLQLRIAVDEVASLIKKLSTGKLNWEEASKMYPAFTQQEASATT